MMTFVLLFIVFILEKIASIFIFTIILSFKDPLFLYKHTYCTVDTEDKTEHLLWAEKRIPGHPLHWYRLILKSISVGDL